MVGSLTAPARTPSVTGGTVPVAVTGLGVALPEEVVTNHDWEERLDTSDEWITSRTGIRERRRAAPDQAASDLGVEAAAAALTDAGVDAGTVDTVIVATTTPDHLLPQTAPIVASAFGLEVPAFDVGAGCTGFVYGLAVAAGWITAGLADRVLLVGAEVLTKLVDDTDRSTAVLFGDGGGACVLDRRSGAAAAGDGHPDTAGGTLGPFDLGSDGNLADALIVPAGGTRLPASHDTVDAHAHTLEMRGREVYRNAVARMVGSCRTVLEQADLEPGEVDLLVGHQANARILDAVAGRLGLDSDQGFVVVDRYGNTSAASIPIALADARAAGRLTGGLRILLTAFGAGLTWGSCLMAWPEEPRDG